MRTILSLLCVLFVACGTPESSEKQQKASNTETSLTGEAENKVEERLFFDGKLKMLFPATFEEMDYDVMLAKYDKNNLPSFVYTNDDNSVNCVINFTENPSSLDKLPEYASIFSRRLESDEVKVYKSEIETINKRDFLVLEFQTPAKESSLYNYMAIGVLDSRLFMVTFNCLEEKEAGWKSIGKEIINSIKFPKEI